MILVDSSAWIEFLRTTGTSAHQRVASLLRQAAPLGTCEPVVMEVLAGARDDVHLARLRQLMTTLRLLPLEGLVDYEDAAAIFRACRRQGETIRSLTHCLIAVAALRHEAELLHWDSDFEVIARYAPLRQSRG